VGKNHAIFCVHDHDRRKVGEEPFHLGRKKGKLGGIPEAMAELDLSSGHGSKPGKESGKMNHTLGGEGGV